VPLGREKERIRGRLRAGPATLNYSRRDCRRNRPSARKPRLPKKMEPDRALKIAEALASEGFDATIDLRGEQGREGHAKATVLATAARVDLVSLRRLLEVLDEHSIVTARMVDGRTLSVTFS
jgi:hypothetical protein